MIVWIIIVDHWSSFLGLLSGWCTTHLSCEVALPIGVIHTSSVVSRYALSCRLHESHIDIKILLYDLLMINEFWLWLKLLLNLWRWWRSFWWTDFGAADGLFEMLYVFIGVNDFVTAIFVRLFWRIKLALDHIHFSFWWVANSLDAFGTIFFQLFVELSHWIIWTHCVSDECAFFQLNDIAINAYLQRSVLLLTRPMIKISFRIA